jgi:hypothetical protein
VSNDVSTAAKYTIPHLDLDVAALSEKEVLVYLLSAYRLSIDD